MLPPRPPTQTLTPDECCAEHSLELQFPFLAYRLLAAAGRPATTPLLVPLVVGGLTAAQEAAAGAAMAPFILAEGTKGEEGGDPCLDLALHSPPRPCFAQACGA